MAKEDIIVSCGKKNPTEREVELQCENVSLARQLGGLKTSNANYRKQVENLTRKLDTANLTIDELRGRIASYNNQILEYKDRIVSLKEENNGLHDAIEYEQKPWWKKIF